MSARRLIPRSSSLIPSDSFLTVARVVRPHGTAGELACEIITEFPQRFRKTATLYIATEGALFPRPYPVQRARLVRRGAGTQLLLKLEGVDDRDGAEALRGALVQVAESEAWKLPPGRFYWHQIIGLRAVTTEGDELGRVAEILETGANDVYVVQSERGELLVPAIKEVIKRISPEDGMMVVKLMPGMRDEE